MLCSIFSVQIAMIVSSLKSSSLRLVVDNVLVHGGAMLTEDGSLGAGGLARGAACCAFGAGLLIAVDQGLETEGGPTQLLGSRGSLPLAHGSGVLFADTYVTAVGGCDAQGSD